MWRQAYLLSYNKILEISYENEIYRNIPYCIIYSTVHNLYMVHNVQTSGTLRPGTNVQWSGSSLCLQFDSSCFT